MLPGQILSVPTLSGSFLSPRGSIRSAADGNLVSRSIGGVGINDTTQGLASQIWTGSFNGASINLVPASGSPYASPTFGAVVWFDFCFDQSMNPVIAFALSDGSAAFYWFDSTVPGFVITALPAGTDPWPYCAMDDTRASQVQSSDVIVSFTNAGELYFLAQRDRFGVQYHLGHVGTTQVLTQAGMNNVGRFQFQFNALLPDQISIEGKFVPAAVYSPVLIPNVGAVRPRIYMPLEDVTVRTRR